MQRVRHQADRIRSAGRNPSAHSRRPQMTLSERAPSYPAAPKYIRDFKGIDNRSSRHPGDSEQLRSVPRTSPAFAGTVDCNGGIPLEQKGHVMSDMILKADQERPGRTQPSDIVWAVSHVIVIILLVLLWANVPA